MAINSGDHQGEKFVPIGPRLKRFKMRYSIVRSTIGKSVISFASFILLATFSFASVRAQSTEIESPTPVGYNQISGTISPLDIGDPRLTHHYYAFFGTQGDLIVTVVSQNLNGDVDIFAANGLRPLMKISMYATESTSSASKTVFLHSREPMILRIEARSPNDENGTYRVSFAGGFEPSPLGASENTETPDRNRTSARTPGTRRVTSVGATIEEPAPPPVAKVEAPPVTPTPTESPSPTPEAGEKTNGNGETATTPAKPPTHRTPTRRSGARRPASGSRTARTRPSTEAAKKPAATAEKPAEAAEKPATAPAKQDIPALPSAKLLVELKDGTRIEQSMGTIRRVTIDNGQIVIVHNSGRIERVPMSNVLRMSIAP